MAAEAHLKNCVRWFLFVLMGLAVLWSVRVVLLPAALLVIQAVAAGWEGK